MQLTFKKIAPFLAVILPSVILFVSVYLFFFRSGPTLGSGELIRSVPVDALCFIESSQPAAVVKEIRNTAIWEEALISKGLSIPEDLLQKMDSVIRSYSRLMQNFEEYPAVFGWQMVDDDVPEPFIILEVPSGYQRMALHRFIGEMAEGRQTASGRYRGKRLYRVTGPEGEIQLYHAFIKNSWIASTDSNLQHMVMDQALDRDRTLRDDPSFEKAYGTTGKKVNAHLLLNNSKLKRILPLLLDEGRSYSKTNPYFPDGWSAFDVTIKRNELIFNGFTTTENADIPFCQLYMGSAPQDIKIHKILPYNTVFSIQTTAGDFGDFFRKINNIKGNSDSLRTRDFHSLRDPSVKIDLEKRIQSIAGPEICLAITGSPEPDLKLNTFLILRSEQMETSLISLNLLSDPASNANIRVGEHMIGKLILPNPYILLFDLLSEDNLLQWFTVLDDYIVFGETPAAVHKFLSYYLSGRTMGSNPSCSEYLDYFPEKSNLTFQMNIRNASEGLIAMLADTLAAGIRSNKDMLSRFDGLAIHYSAMNDMFYTTAHLNYNPAYVEESPYLWKTRLDTVIFKGPQLIENPVTGKGNVVVFDQSGQMILIDEKGLIQWEKKLSGPVLSDVFLVEYGQDRQSHLLCNTTDSIYLLSLDGQRAQDYPVPVPSGASNGLTVLDYNKNRDYRIIVAARDLKILNLDIKGNPVKGWNSPVIDSEVVDPVQHLVAAGKDYLIFSLRGGKVLMTDRKGNIRLKPDQSFLHSEHASFYAAPAQANGIMYTTDIYGSVVYITSKGTTRKVSFGDYLPDHCFVSADFNMDKKVDFIFLDKNRITVYDQKHTLISEVPFPEEISLPPLVFTQVEGRTYLGFYSGQSGNIYLLSKDGHVQWVREIKSDRPFQIGFLDNKTTLHLIAAYENEIFNYLFE